MLYTTKMTAALESFLVYNLYELDMSTLQLDNQESLHSKFF